MTLAPDQVVTPMGSIVSRAVSLFERPYGCTLLFPPEADLAQLEDVVRSICGRELALPADADGSRRLELTTEARPAVVDHRLIPVVDPTAVSEDAMARALVRVTVRGSDVVLVLQAVQVVPCWTEAKVR